MITKTQTLAWCTWYIEFAHSAHSRTPCDVVSHLIGSRLKAQDLSLVINISIVIQVRTSLSRLSFSTSTCSSLSSSFPSTSCTPSCTQLDNLIVMESLCYSANKGSDDAYDVSTSLTVYTHVLQDRNCEICERTNTRAPCRRRNDEAVLRAENFGDLITRSRENLVEWNSITGRLSRQFISWSFFRADLHETWGIG